MNHRHKHIRGVLTQIKGKSTEDDKQKLNHASHLKSLKSSVPKRDMIVTASGYTELKEYGCRLNNWKD